MFLKKHFCLPFCAMKMLTGTTDHTSEIFSCWSFAYNCGSSFELNIMVAKELLCLINQK